MNAIVVYYSRTGNTKKAAEAIAKTLSCDLEELVDTQKRSGVGGWLRSGRQAMKEELTTLEPLKKDISKYDLVIIGTPIWASKMSAPTLTFLNQNKAAFKEVAFFHTSDGKNNATIVFPEMETACGKKPKATLGLMSKEIKKDLFMEKVQAFVKSLSG